MTNAGEARDVAFRSRVLAGAALVTANVVVLHVMLPASFWDEESRWPRAAIVLARWMVPLADLLLSAVGVWFSLGVRATRARRLGLAGSGAHGLGILLFVLPTLPVIHRSLASASSALTGVGTALFGIGYTILASCIGRVEAGGPARFDTACRALWLFGIAYAIIRYSNQWLYVLAALLLAIAAWQLSRRVERES